MTRGSHRVLFPMSLLASKTALSLCGSLELLAIPTHRPGIACVLVNLNRASTKVQGVRTRSIPRTFAVLIRWKVPGLSAAVYWPRLGSVP